ncbi:GNAT family N-acetyltransferase [Flavobacteriaceae bacterium]|jgi:GNAT superfamily N-acetyltransferase|nr:GNAT family N-acetyltransferase [Flavobacteriaceae bacterium]MDB4134482.1 GNAT family N-acetyltransferase [Flavobacteriaceae bacterium]MDC0623375.1 GNAT family N-acetyltransferase [Flavobacteriaceae bacterium]|tara:strand:- start:801 stop:1271 length:471 start_codon:yes stop_codon:yes gene_type:complete
MKIIIREAQKDDMSDVISLIKELAEFEKEPNEVDIDSTVLVNDGFEENSYFKCFVAENKDSIIGTAIIYNRYSTWKGRTIHLEDLIVTEKMRANGVGTLLLNQVVNYAKKLNVKRVSWEVINWNKKAIKFYLKKGALIKQDWSIVHLDNKALKNYK